MNDRKVALVLQLVDGANECSARDGAFFGKAGDTRPAFAIVVRTVSECQKDDLASAVSNVLFPCPLHNFDAHG